MASLRDDDWNSTSRRLECPQTTHFHLYRGDFSRSCYFSLWASPWIDLRQHPLIELFSFKVRPSSSSVTFRIISNDPFLNLIFNLSSLKFYCERSERPLRHFLQWNSEPPFGFIHGGFYGEWGGWSKSTFSFIFSGF